jgi:hypothetical protein
LLIHARRQQSQRPWIVLLDILDDDARFRNNALASRVVEHGDLANGPFRQQRRCRARIEQIDLFSAECHGVLVKRDQNLLTEGGQGVEVQGE